MATKLHTIQSAYQPTNSLGKVKSRRVINSSGLNSSINSNSYTERSSTTPTYLRDIKNDREEVIASESSADRSSGERPSEYRTPPRQTSRDRSTDRDDNDNEKSYKSPSILPELTRVQNKNVLNSSPILNSASASTPRRDSRIISNHTNSSHNYSNSRESNSEMANYNRKEIGLNNLGNTCFMNVALQCLLHIPELINYFLSGGLDRDLNKNSPKKGLLATAFHQLIKEIYYQCNGHPVTPNNLQKAVCYHAPYLMDYQQQDSQEFLRFFLDGMAEDLCRTKIKSVAPVASPATPMLPSRSEATLASNLNSCNSISVVGVKNQYNDIHSACLPKLAADNKQISSVSASTRNDELTIVSARASSRTSDQYDADDNLTFIESDNETIIYGEPVLDDEEDGKLIGGNESCVPGSVVGIAQQQTAISEVQQTNSNDIKVSRAEKLRSTTLAMREQTPEENDEVVVDRSNSNNSPRKPSIRAIEEVKKARADTGIAMKSDTVGDSSASELDSAALEEMKKSVSPLKERISRNQRKFSDENMTGSSVDSNDYNKHDNNKALEEEKAFTTAQNDAKLAWDRYLKFNDSVITDIFAGQLQSTIVCLTCQNKSSSFDPFLDLSIPIIREGERISGKNSGRSTGGGFLNNLRSSSAAGNKSTLDKCLTKFTAEETMEGDDMYLCEKCNAKRKGIKKLSVYRYPKVLIIHIKRFRYSTTTREKLSTDVQFPLAGLDLRPYLSSDLMSPDQYRAQLSTIDNVFRINAVNTNDDINNSNGDAVDSRRSNSHIIASSMSQVNGATRGSKSSLIQGVTRMDDHNDLQCSMDSLMNNKGSVAGSPSLNTDALEDSLESLNMNSIPFPNAIHEPVYDLIGVSNHHGNLHGGHYVAHVNVNAGDKQSNPENSKWMCFNDSRVSNAIPTSIAGPTAYVLFYRLRE